MAVSTIDIKEFKKMIHAGKKSLESQIEYVNSLNVFPVPDGDTGTNMNLTFTNGNKAVQESEAEAVGELSDDFSNGLLMGARGNSGVILSQLFRGFSKSMEDKAVLTGIDLAEALQMGVDYAYDALMKPVEGTILTVARESAEAALEKSKTTDDATEVMEEVVRSGQISLDNTPNLLEVLKEVGVVDSGGQGLVFIYRGFLSSLKGEELDLSDFHDQTVDNIDLKELAHQHEDIDVSSSINTQDIKFGYCTEIMVRLGEGETVTDEFDEDQFKEYLDSLGDSLLVVSNDEVAKVHVHTERPGEVMNYGQKFGSLMSIKVDNMREQHRTLLKDREEKNNKKEKEKEKYGIISVASGQGMQDLYKSMGVDYVISGGQTMNPSTEDFIAAIEEVHAENIILMPNNGNILMAAEQAASVAQEPTVVVPTKNLSQGFNALFGFNPEADLETNQENMSEEMQYVKNGQVTYAIRDTEIDGIQIKKDDFMGLIDGDIKVSEKTLSEATLKMINKMIDEDSEIITIIYGEDASLEQAEEIAERLEEEHEMVEVEIHEGQQPVYPFVVSVE